MTTENNQPGDNTAQPRYQPPNSYSNYNNTSNQVTYSWPAHDATEQPQANILPPIIPIPPDSMPYLTPPMLDPQAELYRQAAKRADAKLKFYHHLRNYVMVNLILWGIAIITTFTTIGSAGHRFDFWTLGWPLWVTLFWGIGLVSEYVNVFMMSEQRKQDMIEAEMRRMRR